MEPESALESGSRRKNAAQNMIFLRTVQRFRTGSRFAKKKPQPSGSCQGTSTCIYLHLNNLIIRCKRKPEAEQCSERIYLPATSWSLLLSTMSRRSRAARRRIAFGMKNALQIANLHSISLSSICFSRPSPATRHTLLVNTFLLHPFPLLLCFNLRSIPFLKSQNASDFR